MRSGLQIVVCTWGESQRDIEMVVQILEQVSRALLLCQSHYVSHAVRTGSYNVVSLFC